MELSNPDAPVDEMIASGGKMKLRTFHIPADDESNPSPVGGGQSASSPKSDLLRKTFGNKLVGDLEKLDFVIKSRLIKTLMLMELPFITEEMVDYSCRYYEGKNVVRTEFKLIRILLAGKCSRRCKVLSCRRFRKQSSQNFPT